MYQKYWHIVGADVTKVCLDILNNRSPIASLISIHLVLIPKVKNPRRITEYRPISLFNVMYKFITKALSNRLRRYLGSVISENQNAFVPGRLISDNVAVAFEMMHSMKKRNNGSKGWLSLKLDMSKVYGRLEWCFVDAMMTRVLVRNGEG